MDVKPRLLFSLSRHSKQAGDACDLTHNVPSFQSFHPLHLSLPDPIPDLISSQVSPRALPRKEAQSRFDASFQEELERVSLGVHSAIEVHPDLFHFHVRLINAPRELISGVCYRIRLS
jgi:hypothetical protein